MIFAFDGFPTIIAKFPRSGLSDRAGGTPNRQNQQTKTAINILEFNAFIFIFSKAFLGLWEGIYTISLVTLKPTASHVLVIIILSQLI